MREKRLEQKRVVNGLNYFGGPTARVVYLVEAVCAVHTHICSSAYAGARRMICVLPRTPPPIEILVVAAAGIRNNREQQS